MANYSSLKNRRGNNFTSKDSSRILYAFEAHLNKIKLNKHNSSMWTENVFIISLVLTIHRYKMLLTQATNLTWTRP